MWTTIQAHAAKHALMYAIAMGLGLQAFFTGLYDNFWSLEPQAAAALGWWQIASLFCKSLSAPIGIVVGYLIKTPNGVHGDTTKTQIEPANEKK